MSNISLHSTCPCSASVKVNGESRVSNIISKLIINLTAVANIANEHRKVVTEGFHHHVESGTKEICAMANMLSEIEQLCIKREYLLFAQFFAGVRNISITLAGMGFLISDYHKQGLSAVVETMKTGESFPQPSRLAGGAQEKTAAEAVVHASVPKTPTAALLNDCLADYRNIAKANAGLLLIAARKRIINSLWSITGFMATAVKKGAVSFTTQCKRNVVPSLKKVLLKVGLRFNRVPTHH